MQYPTPFQPNESAILSKFKRGQRTFVASWYNTFKWLTLCVKRNKVFCAYCRYAHSHGLITFARRGDQTTFSATGFDNYKKGVDKFNHHAHSSAHQEAVLKCSAMSQPSIESQLSSQFRKQQQLHREGLIKQLAVMKFLLRQGPP